MLATRMDVRTLAQLVAMRAQIFQLSLSSGIHTVPLGFVLSFRTHTPFSLRNTAALDDPRVPDPSAYATTRYS